jgi:hypothetical protein
VTSAPLLPQPLPSESTPSLSHSRAMSEDAWILRLANELLLHIISYLRAFEIERLARTFNRRLTDACLPHLQGRIAGARNRRLMMNTFTIKDYNFFYDSDINELFHSWFAKTHTFSPPPTDAFANVDHFDLRGDFSWMYPTQSEELRTTFHPILFTRNPPIATAEQIDELVSAASALGVSLPPCFRRFMIDEELHNRVPYLDRNFTTSPFVKLDLEVHGVGYATPFFRSTDLEIGETFYLFAGDQGCTGVIRMNNSWEYLRNIYEREEASYHWPALSTLERELGVIPVPAQLSPDTVLCACDFEEFLFQLYFHYWAFIVIDEGLGDASPFRPSLEQFLFRAYTEEGRVHLN